MYKCAQQAPTHNGCCGWCNEKLQDHFFSGSCEVDYRYCTCDDYKEYMKLCVDYENARSKLLLKAQTNISRVKDIEALQALELRKVAIEKEYLELKRRIGDEGIQS